MLVTLQRELTAIRHRLGQREGLAIRPSADPADRVVASMEHDLTAATVNVLTARARRLTIAVARARTGDYGVCVGCGQRIASKRLKALPDADLCIGCQAEAERG